MAQLITIKNEHNILLLFCYRLPFGFFVNCKTGLKFLAWFKLRHCPLISKIFFKSSSFSYSNEAFSSYQLKMESRGYRTANNYIQYIYATSSVSLDLSKTNSSRKATHTAAFSTLILH